MARTPLNKLISLVESASEEAPIEKQFISDLTYSIECDAGKGTYKPSKTFKPSSIGGCDRKIYYQLTEAKKDTNRRQSANNVGILQNGTDRHERIQTALCAMKDNGIDCEYIDVETFVKMRHLDHIQIVAKQGIETKCFWKEIPLSFLTDGIIRYKGKYYIIEIKTMGNQKYFTSKTVREEHKAQGICYSAAFGLDNVLYLYENRDTLDKKAFLFHVTDEMRKHMLDKTERIKKNVADGTPPEVEPNANKCRYCEYRQICKNDG